MGLFIHTKECSGLDSGGRTKRTSYITSRLFIHRPQQHTKWVGTHWLSPSIAALFSAVIEGDNQWKVAARRWEGENLNVHNYVWHSCEKKCALSYSLSASASWTAGRGKDFLKWSGMRSSNLKKNDTDVKCGQLNLWPAATLHLEEAYILASSMGSREFMPTAWSTWICVVRHIQPKDTRAFKKARFLPTAW